MKLWPWSRFAVYDGQLDKAYLERDNVIGFLTKSREESARWHKRYNGATELLHQRQAEFTQAQVDKARLEAESRGKDYQIGRLETDLSEARMDLRSVTEKLNLSTLQLQNRPITIPRDIFDEQPGPDEYVDHVGPDALELAEKMLTAESWKGPKG